MDWKPHKALNKLYKAGKTAATIVGIPEVDQLIGMHYIQHEGKSNLIPGEDFKAIYEKKYLPEFKRFRKLLIELGLSDKAFSGTDLESLLKLKEDAAQFSLGETPTLKEISSKYFSSSKRISKNSNLHLAVSCILKGGLAEAARAQYLLVLHSKQHPKAILLCENKNLLDRPRRNDVELWYAGGKNTAKLQFVPVPSIPIYYICDWDQEGLNIYLRIKTKYLANIELIVPQAPKFKSIEDTDHHIWKDDFDLGLFSTEQKEIIKKLIAEGMWIEEESIEFEF